ncbi:MAG TPA: DUF4105 domain-containing protein, partial [Thermodesulfobacteriota bacterium]
ARALHEDRHWLRLGHYRRGLLSGWKSQVDGPTFFLAPDGRTNPEAELTATIAAFFEPVGADPNAHPQCRFPGRYRWLRSALGLDPSRLPAPTCSRFEAFRATLAPRSATLVFSSYYLNNPSSAFGHTFLRINKSPHGAGARRLDLLDYGIEYAATVDTNNALVYAFKGLSGGFKGQWTYWPYYYKVRLYNDFEKRDLWEYDLDLTPEQLEMVVAHVWELGASWFDYYYLSENCSYHILTLLEAADPSLELTEHLPWWVIPADTVKALFESPGLVREVRYRPSIWTQFERRAARLGPAEIRLVERVVEDPGAPMPPEMAPERRAAVLDAALDLVDARYARPLLANEPGATHRKQILLERRSEVPADGPNPTFAPPLDRMPSAGHDSIRLGASAGYSDRLGFFQRLDFRFALHDLTDPSDGYPDHAQIEFGATRLRYNADPDTLWLEELALVRVASLSPITRFGRDPSWKFSVGAETVRDESCRDCLAGGFDVGAGYAVPLPGLPAATAFLTADAEALVSGEFVDRAFRFGIGPTGGLHARLGDRVSLLATGSWRYLVDFDPGRTYEYTITAKVHLTRRLSLGLEGSKVPDAWEGALGAYLYF